MTYKWRYIRGWGVVQRYWWGNWRAEMFRSRWRTSGVLLVYGGADDSLVAGKWTRRTRGIEDVPHDGIYVSGEVDAALVVAEFMRKIRVGAGLVAGY